MRFLVECKEISIHLTSVNSTSSAGQDSSAQAPLWSIPVIPSAVELYDLLMKDIEPELLSNAIAGLALKYRKETKEEAAKRAERYAKAFAAYDRKLEIYIGELNAQIRKFGKEAAASMEAIEHAIKEVNVDTPTDDSSPKA